MKKAILGLMLSILVFIDLANGQAGLTMQQALSPQQASIVPIASYTAKGDLSRLKLALSDGLDTGLSINQTNEILVQLYAYTGFPRSLNAISTFEKVLIERRQKGINDVVGKQASPQLFNQGKFTYGKNVQTALTGTTAIGAPQRFVPVMDTFLKEHLFADIFGRDNLDFQQREIATISALASLSDAESQLFSHLKVGRNIGFSEQQMREIASTLSNKVGWQEGDRVHLLLDSMYGTTHRPPKSAGANDDNLIFLKGEKVASNHFTGTVWLHMMVNTDTTYNINAGNVTFEPGARTHWHAHPGGQILLVTSGIGRYQEQGKPIRELHKGDVMTCEPHVVHWHGAAPHSEFSHIAIGTNQDQGAVRWLEPVTDKEYRQ